MVENVSNARDLAKECDNDATEISEQIQDSEDLNKESNECPVLEYHKQPHQKTDRPSSFAATGKILNSTGHAHENDQSNNEQNVSKGE